VRRKKRYEVLDLHIFVSSHADAGLFMARRAPGGRFFFLHFERLTFALLLGNVHFVFCKHS